MPCTSIARDSNREVRPSRLNATIVPGQLIARIDPTDYRLAVDNARAALVSAEADYARAKADLERYQALRGGAAFMAQTLDQRQSLASTALAHVDQAKSQLSTAENNLAYTELRADAAGVITAVQAEVGQVLAQGQGMVKLARSEELEISVGVPEHRLKTVREASLVTFELWSDKLGSTLTPFIFVFDRDGRLAEKFEGKKANYEENVEPLVIDLLKK